MPPPPGVPSLLRCGTRTANGNITCKNSAHICKIVSGVGSAVSRARDEQSRDGAWEPVSPSHTISTWRVLWQRDGAQTECRWGVIFGNYVSEWLSRAPCHPDGPLHRNTVQPEPRCCCAGARLIAATPLCQCQKWISSPSPRKSHLLL